MGQGPASQEGDHNEEDEEQGHAVPFPNVHTFFALLGSHTRELGEDTVDGKVSMRTLVLIFLRKYTCVPLGHIVAPCRYSYLVISQSE